MKDNTWRVEGERDRGTLGLSSLEEKQNVVDFYMILINMIMETKSVFLCQIYPCLTKLIWKNIY